MSNFRSCNFAYSFDIGIRVRIRIVHTPISLLSYLLLSISDLTDKLVPQWAVGGIIVEKILFPSPA
jgi:hypothetical protein